MTQESLSTQEIVVLLSGDAVAREMLYSEFEALLDGFIPIPEFKNAAIKSVYLVVDDQLHITSAVFFLLDFDEKGLVDRRWNIPLQQLASVSGKGPDLGAGAIRLACFSQCAIAWQQKKLWDPVMDSPNASFNLLRQLVESNRVGLIFKQNDYEDIPVLSDYAAESSDVDAVQLQQKLHDHYSQALQEQITRVLKEQRFHIATLYSKHQEKIHKLQTEHQQRLEAYQHHEYDLSAEISALNSLNATLKENLAAQVTKTEGLREYFSHKLQMAQTDEGTQIQALQDSFAIELELKLQTATAELREMLDMREVELFYRHQNESALKAEIVSVRRELQELMGSSGDHLLARLAGAGVNFVVYHPGAGQVAIAADDVGAYLENPLAFIARYIGISENVYSQWLEHYQNPVCHSLDASGSPCLAPLHRVGSPIEFHEGESNCCHQHQRFGNSLQM